jgi:hypothetical protein
MSATERDELFAALSRLPPPTQHKAARAETLTLTLRALASDGAHPGTAAPGGGRADRVGRSFVGRWLTRERFVPAVLCLAGALYTHGAVRQLVSVFAREPASLVRAAREIDHARAPLERTSSSHAGPTPATAGHVRGDNRGAGRPWSPENGTAVRVTGGSWRGPARGDGTGALAKLPGAESPRREDLGNSESDRDWREPAGRAPTRSTSG